MKRTGQGLDIMVFMYLIATFILTGVMFASPSILNTAVEVQISDYDPQIKTATITTYMEEEYTDPATNDSMYYGLFRSGREDMGAWTPWFVRSEDATRDIYETRINETLRTLYFGALASGGGCQFAGTSQIGAKILWEQEDRMKFNVSDPAPFRVNCVTLRQLAAAEGQSLRSLRSIQYPRLPSTTVIYGTRYLKMHDIAKRVAEDTAFRQTIEDTVDRSSNILWFELSGYAGDCDPYAESGASCPYAENRQVDYPTFEGASTVLENEQEHRLLNQVDIESKLQEAADGAVSDFTSGKPEYDGLDITITVEEMEYRATDPTVLQEDWRIYDTEQSCFRENCEGPKSCDACGCSVSCDPPAPEPCPPTIVSTTTYDQNPPTRGGDLWTEDPWSHPHDGRDYGDPLSGPEFSWTDSDLRFTAGHGMLQPLNVVRSGAPETRFVQTGGDQSCPGDSCSESCKDTSAENRVHQTARRVWEVGTVQSFVRVKINVTDTSHRIPVRGGFKHPQFIVRYDQISAETFS